MHSYKGTVILGLSTWSINALVNKIINRVDCEIILTCEWQRNEVEETHSKCCKSFHLHSEHEAHIKVGTEDGHFHGAS